MKGLEAARSTLTDWNQVNAVGQVFSGREPAAGERESSDFGSCMWCQERGCGAIAAGVCVLVQFGPAHYVDRSNRPSSVRNII